MSPDQVHKWRLTADTRGFQLIFSESLVEKVPEVNISQHLFVGKPVQIFSPDETKELTDEFITIEKELSTNDSLSDTILASRLKIIFLLLERWRKEHANGSYTSPQHRIVNRFKILIENYYKGHHPIQFYTDHLNITANYLNILCKKELQQTAGQQIRKRLQLEAKRLLAVTTLSVKEIAYSLKFSDVSYFSRFFKKNEGITPTEFRAKSQKVQQME